MVVKTEKVIFVESSLKPNFKLIGNYSWIWGTAKSANGVRNGLSFPLEFDTHFAVVETFYTMYSENYWKFKHDTIENNH